VPRLKHIQIKGWLRAAVDSTTTNHYAVAPIRSCNFRASVLQDVIDEAKVTRNQIGFLRTTKAVVTDIHFVIPLAVLLIGIVFLVELH
jgi:hypothetical protein